MINDQGRAFWYGPNGEQRILEQGEEVPRGWKDHPFAPVGQMNRYAMNNVAAQANLAELVNVAESTEALAKFDHDGDGKPGGSLPKKRRKAK